MTAAASTLPTSQFWNMPEGFLVDLRQDTDLGWAELRVLAAIGVFSSGNWFPGSRPHHVHSYRSQTWLGSFLGLDRRTVSGHVQRLQQWTWRDQDVLRTTRAGSTAGCLAYGTPCLPKGSRSGRHISRDVLELDAWRALSNPAAVLYLLLRDDYRRASGAGVGLDCQIKGEDREGHLALADRYRASESTIREGLAELEHAKLITREVRKAVDGRDIGIRVRLYDIAPGDAPVPRKGGRWLGELAKRVAAAVEELKQSGLNLRELGLEVTWSELKGARSAAAVWPLAKHLRRLVRRKNGRAYPVRTLAQACGLMLRDGLWRHRDEATRVVDARHIAAEEHADAARDFGPSPDVLAGVMAHVPSQGPAPHPPQHGVGAARLWAEARRALRLEHGDGIQQMLETCTAELDRSPKDSHADDGPVLWVTAPSYLVAQVVVLEHLAALRVATGCRIGFRGSFRAPPPQWAIDRMGSSRGPP